MPAGQGVNMLIRETVADFGSGAAFYSMWVGMRRARELTSG
jgi:hypothetical protein